MPPSPIFCSSTYWPSRLAFCTALRNPKITEETTVQVAITNPHTITSPIGIHGNAAESSARRVSPPARSGVTNVGVRIVGTPARAEYSSVRRGDDGINAARIVIINAEPTSPKLD